MCLCGKGRTRGDGEPSGGTVGAFRGAERQHLLITQARAVIRTGCPQVRGCRDGAERQKCGGKNQLFPSSGSTSVTLGVIRARPGKI